MWSSLNPYDSWTGRGTLGRVCTQVNDFCPTRSRVGRHNRPKARPRRRQAPVCCAPDAARSDLAQPAPDEPAAGHRDALPPAGLEPHRPRAAGPASPGPRSRRSSRSSGRPASSRSTRPPAPRARGPPGARRCCSRSSPAPPSRSGSTSATSTSASRSATSRASWWPRTGRRPRSTTPRPRASTSPHELVRASLRGAGIDARPPAGRRHGPRGADLPGHGRDRGRGHPARMARHPPGGGDARRGSACPSSSRTTPTSAPSARRSSARPAASTTSSTCASPRASAPGSSSAAARTAASAASPARSATCWPTPPGRSAAAATAAAWRRSPARWRWPRCSSAARGTPVPVASLLELVAADDRGARRAVADAGEAIGRALSMLVNVLNPELVVVGGDLAPAGAGPPRPHPGGDRAPRRGARGGRGARDGRDAGRPRRGPRRGGPHPRPVAARPRGARREVAERAHPAGSVPWRRRLSPRPTASSSSEAASAASRPPEARRACRSR